ncbi:MAG TPA: M20 family metallopeptidase [Eubacteriales bacterium]|nr:M20 family metallopeptidase [Clostridia bacterium]HRV73048.1 M20 family metallopeptidase [Eubacteriales bacterium]
MTNEQRERLFSQADRAAKRAILIRRELHRRPELSGQERETALRISHRLQELGIPYSVSDKHAVVGVIGTGREPAVGIRADIDALPVLERSGLPFASENEGVMHACGHDMHTAILLGAAEVLKQRESELKGTVKLFFQPNEETDGGAKDMIADGCMDSPKVTHTVSLHVNPFLPAGKAEFLEGHMNAAVTDMRIRVIGKSCHGAHPDGGCDAILVASQVVTALQSIVSRSLAPTDAGVVTIGSFHAGSKENIIAGEAVLCGTLRALDNAVMDKLKEKVTLIAERTAEAFGASAELYFKTGYPALINDAELTASVEGVAAELLGAENVIRMDAPSLGADDFAYFANASQGCYFNIGAGGDWIAHPLHNADVILNEDCIRVGILLETGAALKILED